MYLGRSIEKRKGIKPYINKVGENSTNREAIQIQQSWELVRVFVCMYVKQRLDVNADVSFMLKQSAAEFEKRNWNWTLNWNSTALCGGNIEHRAGNHSDSDSAALCWALSHRVWHTVQLATKHSANWNINRATELKLNDAVAVAASAAVAACRRVVCLSTKYSLPFALLLLLRKLEFYYEKRVVGAALL